MASSSKAEQHHQAALTFLGEGDHAAALSSIEKSLSADLTWAASHATHALILTLRGEADAAARALTAAERLDPDLPYVHFTRGVILEQEDPRRAIEALRTANRGDPENPRFMIHLGLALLRQGETSEARNLLSQVSKLEPEDTLSLMLLADAAISEKDWDEARRLSQRIVDIDPDSADAHGVLAQLALHEGQYQLAGEHASAALALDPNSDSLREVMALTRTRRWMFTRPWVSLQAWRLRTDKKTFNNLFFAGLVVILILTFTLAIVSYTSALWLHAVVWSFVSYFLVSTGLYKLDLKKIPRNDKSPEEPISAQKDETSSPPEPEPLPSAGTDSQRSQALEAFGRDRGRRGRTLH